MKLFLISLFLISTPTLFAADLDPNAFAKDFLAKIKVGKISHFEKMWIIQSENTKERLPRFLEEIKKFKNLKFKSAKGRVSHFLGAPYFSYVDVRYSIDDKRTLIINFDKISSPGGQWQFNSDFPDLLFIEDDKRDREVIGLESKEKSIKSSMNSFITISTTSYGSQVFAMVCMSSCVSTFESQFKKVSFDEKHLKGGIIGIPWNKLEKAQNFDRKDLKLKSVEDINKTKITATFKSPTHEIVGPMVYEKGRWLFTMGKAEVYLIKDGKRTLVDLGKL